jgi:uncharacterized protein YcfJ
MPKAAWCLLLLWAPAWATDVRIVHVEPRWVTQYQQQCEWVQTRTDNSGVGTVIGAVTGGIVGNQVGRGSGRDAATVAGAVVGGMVGNRIGQDQAQSEMRQQCVMVPVTRPQGEIVTFEYRGRRFTQTFD